MFIRKKRKRGGNKTTKPKHLCAWKQGGKENTQEEQSLKLCHFWGKQEKQIVLKTPFLDINIM